MGAVAEPEYYGFPPYAYEDVSFGVEKISVMLPELRELHQQNWDEIEFGYLGYAMDPDYDLAIQLEERGRFICFTVRDETGAMIGNSLFTMGPNLHLQGKLSATEDTFFLTKDKRRKGIAVAWLTYIRAYLHSLGVSHMAMTDKHPVGGKSLEPLFTFTGFKKIATIYLANIEGE